MTPAPSCNNVLSLWRGMVKPKSRLTMQEIAEAVCQSHGIGMKDLLGRSRLKNLVWARQEFMWIACKQPHLSTVQIGRYLGGRDHSTIVYGRDSHQRRLDQELSVTCKAA